MSIKNKLFRMILSIGMLPRVKHYRGHGIHSPFTYSLVRNVLMKRSVIGDDYSVFYAMRGVGLTRKASRQLQNLYQYLGFAKFELEDNTPVTEGKEQTLYFLNASLPTEQLRQSLDAVRAVGGAAVVIYPRYTRDRGRFCSDYCSQKEFLSVDNRRFLLFLFNNKYPKQHYKL